MKLKTIPRPPAYINGRALSLYKDVAKELKERNLLHKTDLVLIGAYAANLASWEDITIRLLDPANIKEDIILKDKDNDIRQHPLTRLQRMYLENAMNCARLLGISPYFRTRTKQEQIEKAKTRSLSALGKAL